MALLPSTRDAGCLSQRDSTLVLHQSLEQLCLQHLRVSLNTLFPSRASGSHMVGVTQSWGCTQLCSFVLPVVTRRVNSTQPHCCTVPHMCLSQRSARLLVGPRVGPGLGECAGLASLLMRARARVEWWCRASRRLGPWCLAQRFCPSGVREAPP